MRRLANVEGFSLIELVVVLVLTSVILAIGAPQMANFNRGLRINGAARQTRAFLEYARVVALGEGAQVQVRIDPGRREMELLVQSASGDAFEPAAVSGARYRFAEGVRVASIRIDGRLARAGLAVVLPVSPLFVEQGVEIELVDAGGTTRRLTQEAGSGRVVIDD